MASIGKYIKEHNWITVLVLIAIGLALLFVSTYLKKFLEVYILVVNLGAALIVSAIAIWILSHTGRRVEEMVDKEIKNMGDALSSKTDKLGHELTNKMNILAKAQKCGILNIFESRRNDPDYKEELIKQLKGVEKQKEVLMMSISLRDFFGPGYVKEYLSAIFEMLKKEVKIRILLLDPTSDAAKARALVEEKEKVMKYGYIESALFTEIKNVANWLNSPPHVLVTDIRERIKTQIGVRFFPYDPTTHIVKTDKVTFIEQYHKGGNDIIREDLEKEGIPCIDCFGGFVPILMLDNSAFFATLLESHFNNIWNSQDVEERDLRTKDYYTKILEFEKTERN